MKILIVYDTFYGNTQKVAEMMKETLDAHAVDLIKVDVLTQPAIDTADLVVIGSPTRAFNMTKKVKKAIRKYDFSKKRFFAFDTRADENVIESKFLLKMIRRFGYAAEKMERMLERQGGVKARDYRYYFVKDTEGPLYEDVLASVKNDLEPLV